MSAKTAKKMRKIVKLKEESKEDLRVRPNKPLEDGKMRYNSTYTLVNADPVKRKYKEIKRILKNKDLYDHHMSNVEKKDE